MSRNQFIPGRRGNLRNLINKFQLCQINSSRSQLQSDSNSNSDSDSSIKLSPACVLYQDCQCIQENVQRIKTGYNDPTQTQAKRFTQVITGTLGGKTTYGNLGIPANITYLGGIEGQAGGSPRPLRNKF
jgi:hypothetical protein